MPNPRSHPAPDPSMVDERVATLARAGVIDGIARGARIGAAART